MTKNIWKYFVFTFFGVRLFTSTLTPFYLEVGHLTHIQIQLLQSFVSLCMLCFELPTGIIADRFGRKWSLFFGALCDVIAISVMALSHTFEGFLFSQALFAIGFSLISGADDALVYDTLAEQGKQAEAKNIFGKAHAIHLVGMFIAAFIGSGLAARYGLHWPVILSVIPYTIAAIVAWSLDEPQHVKVVAKTHSSWAHLKDGFRYLFQHKTLRLIALDGILVYLAAWFVYWTYPILLEQFHTPLIYFGVFQALSLAAEIAVASNFVRLEKWFGSARRFLQFSALATAIGFFLVAGFPSIITVLLFVILAGGFGQARFELLRAYMNDHIESTHRATVLSGISMIRRVGLFILNPLIGLLMDKSLGVALLIIGVLPLATLLIKHRED